MRLVERESHHCHGSEEETNVSSLWTERAKWMSHWLKANHIIAWAERSSAPGRRLFLARLLAESQMQNDLEFEIGFQPIPDV